MSSIQASKASILRSLALRLLRVSLVLGAVYDLSFAFLMVFLPSWPAQLLSLPLPVEDFYLWLMAILLLMLAALYLAIAYDPWRFFPLALIPAGGRFLGALAFGLAAWGRPDLWGLWVIAAADLIFAIVHGFCLYLARR